MNASAYASNPSAAAALRDPFATLMARLARLAIKLGGPWLASPEAFAQASAAAYDAAMKFVVTQDAQESGADVDEPSMAELLARLAALGENIRRARQRYGMDGRKSASSGDGKSRDDDGEA
jgi:hypothetical protein